MIVGLVFIQGCLRLPLVEVVIGQGILLEIKYIVLDSLLELQHFVEVTQPCPDDLGCAHAEVDPLFGDLLDDALYAAYLLQYVFVVCLVYEDLLTVAAAHLGHV